MPRKIPTQVDQALSRMLKGGYLKDVPTSYSALLAHPVPSLPPRSPFALSPGDLGSSSSNTQCDAFLHTTRRNRLNSAKKAPSLMPKLTPQPIRYLADRIRQRFYEDHPWEAFRPRTLVEGATLQDARVPHPDATDLTAWGRNPGPEDVVACTIHLHRKHQLSLSQAYHHTLSSYHALRAEHEHASRSAVLEARSYGAVFATNSRGQETAAVEIERGYQKEQKELEKGATYFRQTIGSAGRETAGAGSSVTETKTGTIRVKSASSIFSRGQLYLKAALEARDGKKDEPTFPPAGEEAIHRTNQPSFLGRIAPSSETSGLETPQAQSREEQGVKIGSGLARQ